MENIELRWVERPITIPDERLGGGVTIAKIKILQYRKYYDAGAYAGFYATPPAVNLQWSDWTDVPTVIA